MRAHARVLVVALLLSAVAPLLADPIVAFTEAFPSNVAGWSDRDVGELTLSFDPLGHPANALEGSFSAAIPLPETDAIRMTTNASDAAFTGNYHPQFGLIAGWQFDFFAGDVLPSSLLLRFSDSAGNAFYRSLSDQVTAVGVWHSVFAPLDAAADWWGSTNANYSNALHNIATIDLQITRTGGEAQVYRVDNFAVAQQLVGSGSEILTTASGNQFIIDWGGLKHGLSYEVQTATNLPATNWVSLGTFVASNSVARWMDTVNVGDARRFYRLVFDSSF